MISRRRLAALVVASTTVGALALVPATASALSISSMRTAPAGTQAGSHPSFDLSLRFAGDSTPKSMVIQLPPGFVGNPNAVPKCAQATFQAGGCSAQSAVGSTTVYVTTSLLGGGGGGTGGGGGGPLGPVLNPVCTLAKPLCGLLGLGRSAPVGAPRAVASRASTRALGDLPIAAPGTVYDLEPSVGEPARLGIEVRPIAGVLGTIRLQSPVSVRDGSDFGLTSTLDGLPNSFNGLATTITGMDLTLFGTTANGGRFVTLPTSCAVAATRVAVAPYSGAATSASSSFTPTGCANVPFTPSLNVVAQTTRVDSPSGYSIQLAVPGGEDPVRQSHVSDVAVRLPLGTALNPGSAVGLQTCSDAQFGQGSRSAPACPAASVVGTTSFTSPLVGTLAGTVYEGASTPGQMLRLFVDVPGPGLRIKLIGAVDADPRTGQVTSTFSNLPQLPFTAFTLSFRGGDRAILTTPPACGPATSTAALTPYSGNAAAGAASRFTVDYDGQGTACPDPLPFSPSIAASVDPSTAAAPTAMTTTVTRQDRTQRLSDMALSFPPGLLGGLGAGIGLCDLDAARAARCPASSRVGSATLVAGPGGAPLGISGDVFLTAPIGGSLAGLAITVPGKVGPFDLGTTVSFARIVVRPDDAGLDVTASGLPQIVGGIPLDLRQIKLTLDRPGFMRNATSCAAQQIAATFTSTLGRGAQASAPYRATGCDRVPFDPGLSGVVATRSQVRKGSHPVVTAVVSQGPGEISTRSVTVTLPKQVGVDTRRLAVTCPEGQDCGDRNTVGRATAVTPLLPIPLSGPVRLVTPKAGGLPVLKVQLSGPLTLTLTGKTALTKTGRVQNTFAGIPDVPLSRFELALNGGKGGILLNVTSLKCGQRLRGTGDFVGHSGARRSVTGRFEVCGKLKSAASRRRPASATARLRRGALRVTVSGVRAVTRLRIGTPKALRLRGRRGVTVAGGGRQATVRVSRHALSASRLSSRTVRVLVGQRAMRGAQAARRRRGRLSVRVTMGRARVTLRPRIR